MNWSIKKAAEHYNLEQWSLGYFVINESGSLCMQPYGAEGPIINLMDIVEDIREKSLGFPCIVRFQDILRARVAALHAEFKQAIEDNEYQGKYFGVYPVKVNQMREVVEEILDAGSDFHHGLEAGSKAELAIALGLLQDPEALLICNGFKDEDYMRLALMGNQMGLQVIVVIEKLNELEPYLKLAQELKVKPLLGIRAKLTSKGSGRWEGSGGDSAKFGLTVPEIIQATQILESHALKDSLQLLHFHVGSQITQIRTLKDAVTEATRIYSKLMAMDFGLKYLDVGGGLGVDYDGTRTSSDSSMNYSLREYASDIIYNVQQICFDEGVKQPHVVSESGRATVAYHSCLIMDVFANAEYGQENEHVKISHEEIAQEFKRMLDELTPQNAVETYHDALAQKEEALDMFRLGYLDLQERATVETLYWKTCKKVLKKAEELKRFPQEMSDLKESLISQYYANFSVFQSVPDHWAIKQVFPMMPLHRLEEEPTQRSRIVDLTCDSDGKIESFIDDAEVKDHLMLHESQGAPYYMGMFLMGAYQDIMGDIHNLFGRVNEVHVFCDDDDPEDFYIEEVVAGDSVADVLSKVQYAPTELVKNVRQKIDRRIKSGALRPKQGMSQLELFQKVLKGYTYLRT